MECRVFQKVYVLLYSFKEGEIISPEFHYFIFQIILVVIRNYETMIFLFRFATPSGMTSGVLTGVETPDTIELRKGKRIEDRFLNIFIFFKLVDIRFQIKQNMTVPQKINALNIALY